MNNILLNLTYFKPVVENESIGKKYDFIVFFDIKPRKKV